MNENEVTLLLNKILKDLFYKILRLQAKSVSAASGETISRTEMHVIEMIEEMKNATMSDIANSIGISKATASVTIATLSKKGYVTKTQSELDKRKSILALTNKGDNVSKKHQQFHEMMVKSVLKDFKIDEYPDVVKSLDSLLHFFEHLEVSS